MHPVGRVVLHHVLYQHPEVPYGQAVFSIRPGYLNKKHQYVPGYNESTQENILTKVTNNMNAANSRNITSTGLIQVLNAVIKNQILYPTAYANTTDEQIEQMEKKGGHYD